MTYQRLHELITAYREGNFTSEELEELAAVLQEPDLPSEWEDRIRHLLKQHSPLHVIHPELDREIYGYIEAHGHAQTPDRHKIFTWRKLRWAAAVIVLCISAYFLWQPVSQRKIYARSKQLINTIQPATSGAILTLEDGTRIVLDSMGNGVIANQKGVELVFKNGSLIYNNARAKGAVAYNTLQTPKGRQMNIRLPDGTHVWLNAESSIRYPVAFVENERRVQIEGEAYFEVAHDKSKPFLVNVRQAMEIKVTGTHFNVNSYEDEGAYAATLLSGAVEIKALDSLQKTQSLKLSPGQQGRLEKGESNTIKLLPSVDTGRVMAWKNGIFDFNDASLQQVMKQLSRWYNLTIEYENGVPDMKFGGKMGRDLKLADVLHFLEDARVKFRMEEDRKLIVLPGR
ncbi:MAG: FecR domain-containing protein [Chitinophagaceae bacterium]|nr:FecR domain-containing protein [Chitinophagaceae bacterium]